MIKKHGFEGGVLVGILMITIVMSLFALTFAYIINEKINIINTFNQANKLRVTGFKQLEQAQQYIASSPLELIRQKSVKKVFHYPMWLGDYQIMALFSQNDNIDNYHGSLYQVFKLQSNVYDKGDNHSTLSYQSYYWDILSFDQLANDSNKLIHKVIQPPVVNFIRLSNFQQQSYMALINHFKNNVYQVSVDGNYLLLSKGNTRKADSIRIDLGFNCKDKQGKNNCTVVDGWIYKNNNYNYILMVKNDTHLIAWECPYSDLSNINNHQQLLINLLDDEHSQSQFSYPVLLLNQEKQQVILSQVHSKNGLKWLILPLDNSNHMRKITIDKIGKAINMFAISASLNLQTSGIFIYDNKHVLWYLNQSLKPIKILHNNATNHLVNVSVIADDDQYWLFVFYADKIDIFILDDQFKLKKKVLSKQIHFKIINATARYGSVWLLSALRELTVYNWGDLGKKLSEIKADQCLFNTFSNFKLLCNNTEVKINDIVHPYQRQALKEVLPF
ncbi:hypothetical protein L3V83_05605 [Thiotrichales bacterium 19X7-9]|nr:hypothetical protein [Thiotrichales bacterium 19X7-9]